MEGELDSPNNLSQLFNPSANSLVRLTFQDLHLQSGIAPRQRAGIFYYLHFEKREAQNLSLSIFQLLLYIRAD